MDKSKRLPHVAFKKIGKIFQRQKKTCAAEEQNDIYTRTITVCDPNTSQERRELKAILDAGCDAGDMISPQVVSDLALWGKIHPCDKVIGVCLHGHELRSMGTVVLRWEGKGFYKLFETRFHVMEGRSLPWQVILGAATCAEHHLLTVGAYGGRRQILPARSKEEQAEHVARMEEFKREARANKAKVDDNKTKKHVAGHQRSTYSTNSSTNSSRASF